jgi:ring-1,2-phenylacetyl-CoA epoxidase subunit PaaD
MNPISVDQIWQALDQVKDPEIPVVSVVEMGIVRSVRIAGETVTVVMTPTFSGCPALQVMKDAIACCIRQMGAAEVDVRVALSPRWTSDWISDPARQKLKAFGLAPPPRHGGRAEVVFLEPAACPYCGSHDTTVKNTFGSTLCRAIDYCNACRQPFERFKPV